MTEGIENLLYPHLKRDENLLWTGGPEKGFYYTGNEIIAIALGGIFVGVGLIPRFFGMHSSEFALFLVVGLLILIFGLFTGWWFRRHSRYALTDQRAFLIFRHPVSGVRVTGYPIANNKNIRLFGTSPKSVYFANSDRVSINNRPMPLGFTRVKDAEHVYKLMLEIKAK